MLRPGCSPRPIRGQERRGEATTSHRSEHSCIVFEDATLKALRRGPQIRAPSQLFQSCEEFLKAFVTPGFQSKTLGWN